MSRAESSWERLVNAALQRDRAGGASAGGGGPGQGSLMEYVPSSLANNRDIDAILRAADELQDEDPSIARILCEHAYSLAQNLDPNSEGRGVLQFKTGLMSVVKQKLAKREVGTIDRSQDIKRLQDFYRLYREKNNVDTLKEDEKQLRESGVFTKEMERKTLRRKRVFATLKVLGNVLEQVAKEIPDELKHVIDSDAAMSEDTIAYNIIPLDAPVTTNATTSFPEVQAAVAALKYFPGLPKLPADFPIPATRNADMLDFLHYIFGFQKDSVSNQREHIVLLLANEQSRLNIPEEREPKLDDDAVRKVFLKSLDNYIKWCDYLCIQPAWSNLETISGEKRLLFLSLYFLIWGEAANIRFLPECLCYIFHHMVREMDEILRQQVARPAESCMPVESRGSDDGVSFLDHVIAPLYGVVSAEAFNNDNGRAPHSAWRNYDDFNEYFWSLHSFELGWPWRTSSSFFQKPIPRKKYDLQTGRAKHRGKTSFVEHRTFLHLYHSFHRLWIFLAMMFQALAIIAFNKNDLYSRKTLREILSLGPTFVVMKFSESVLDVIMMYGAYSTTRRLAVSRIFLRFIWFSLASVVVSFLYVKALQEDSNPNSNSVMFKFYVILIAIYGGVQFFLSILMRFPTCHNIANKCDRWPVIRFFKWMRQERHYVGRGMYEKTSDFIKYLLFWVVVLSAKFSFAYFLQIKPLVGPTRMIVKQDNIQYSWHDLVSRNNYNALTVASLWAPVVAIYLLDIHIFYTLVSAFLGFLLGARDRLGEIRSLEAIHKQFEEFPGAFMRALHVPITNRTSDPSHQAADKNKVDAAHFAPFWNQIIKCLREEDYITDFEMDLLLMPKNSGRLQLVQWPLFLLSSKILLAKEIAAESNTQEEIIERIERDDYMKYAVEEVYHTLKLVLMETLEAEGRMWVERIYEDIQASIKDRKIHHDFQLNKLSLVITRVTALLGILKENETPEHAKGAIKALQDLYDVMRLDILTFNMRGQYETWNILTQAWNEGRLFTKLKWPKDPELKALVKRLYSLFTIKDSAAHVPRNLEARRRLQFFTNSLFMDVPPPKSVDKMLSFSVFTPYYSEVVLYSMAELTKRNEDGISILFYLQKIYPDEWKNFLARIGQDENALEGDLRNERDILELRFWASYRGQTLARTVRGMMYYRKALMLQSYLERKAGRDGESTPFGNDLTELKVVSGRKPVPLQRVMVLEVSQYLENYLWPNFDPETATFEHVMSMILMINEKFRENVAAWICFHDREDLFKKFLQKVLRLKEGRDLTIAEKTNYLVFMINAFQSLEDAVVNETVLSLAGLQSWHSLSYGRFQMELCLQPDLIKKWKRLSKKWAAEAMSKGEQFDPSSSPEANFVRSLIEEFVEVLDHGVFSDEGDDTAGFQLVDDSSVLYCERFMEFLIDMLNQLPTRRYLRPLVADIAVVAKCRLSVLYKHEKGKLFAQLVDLLQFYEKFEIKDHDGTQLTDDEALQFHYDRFMAFQLLAFKKIPKLRDVALANIGSVHKSSDLRRRLSALSLEDLRDVVCSKLKLVSRNDPWAESKDFLTEVVVSSFEKQQSQKEAINALPLYPNEQIMWDESVIPSINYSGEGCLALPKLNLQFLTLHDYLLRNFNLFRLESTYEIREDIQEAVPHLLAHIDNEGETAFRGWSRMAVPINGFKIAQVKQPNIGEEKPSSVTAEVTFSIKSYRTQIRSEWNSLKEHDVLFLLCIRPSFEPLGAEEADKATVPQRLGLQYVRGCEVIEIRDEEGNLMNDFSGKVKRDEWKPPKGEMRTVTVALDAAQYHIDVTDIAEKGAEDVYGTFNVLMRRKPKENNFKAILESIRDLMNEYCIVPDWLHNVFLGYGNPSAAQWPNMPNLLKTVGFKDTFLDSNHLSESFPHYEVSFVNADGAEVLDPRPPFRITLPKTLKGNAYALSGNKISEVNPSENVDMVDVSPKEKLIVEAYTPPDPGPYPQDQPKQNSVKFTPTQVGAIISGIQPGLTMVVGPPGTGKTDTAVQILNVLYHNCPSQRTLIITHSNQALNDLFEKIMERDVPARYLLRLGQGEQELATDLDFSRQGRVNAMLVRRLELLSEVERLARSLQLPEDVGYTCETAGYFWLLHVYSRWELFLAACGGNENNPSFVQDRFPFKEFFSDAPKLVFSGESFEKNMRAAKGCFTHLKTVFQELEECRAFELLKSTADRANYLMTKQAKIVAMTCTHAALKRRDFLKLGFKYDNLLMEESAQILEIETFIPMLLQRQEDGHSRLKRCILIGDHHQLPPVVKNMAFQKYSHMDQSLFTRFVRLGIPYIELNAQGRARPSLAKLYNWRYRDLGDLSIVKEAPIFHRANAGFSYEYQLINVPDYEGKGESTPSPWFYQNQGEAEYIVSVYIYMRLLGYPANKISILTTYNGQKLLIRDVINRRCVPYSFIGPPSKVTTVDKFQGQQNDFILLSLVRTRFVGHLRDVRRLVVAMSRARLGLYVFCRRSLFEQCYELQPTFQLLLKRPDRLGLNLSENTSAYTDRAVEEVGNPYLVHDVEEMAHIVHDRMNEFYKAQGVYEQYQNHTPQIEDGNHMESDTVVSEDGESEKKMQPEVDGVVDESSKETVSMEVDNGVSSENGKA